MLQKQITSNININKLVVLFNSLYINKYKKMSEKTKIELLQELKILQENFGSYKSRIEKNYELNLKQSKYTFETIFQTNPDGITVSKIDDGTLIQANNSFLSITGYEKHEIIGKTTKELNLWVDLYDRKRLISELTQNGKIENFEAKFKLKDGSIITGLISGKTFEYNNELCLLLITRDITDYKKLIDRSIYNELRFRTIFNNKETGVTILDLNGKFKSANQKFCNMIGYSLDELKEKTYRDISYPSELHQNEKKLEKLYSGEINSFHLEKRYLRKDKTYYWAQIFVSGLYNKEGLVETIGIHIDITQRIYEALKNRVKNELSCLDVELKPDEICKAIPGIISKIYSVKSVHMFQVKNDKSLISNDRENEDGKFNSDKRYEEILIRHIIETKKILTLNSDEIPLFFDKIIGVQQKLETSNWSGAPIIISNKVKYVLVLKSFEKFVHLSHYQNKLFDETAGIISDLLEKKESLAEVKKLSHAIEQSPSLVILTDKEGNIEFVNSKFIEITGYCLKEVVGKNPSIFKSQDRPEERHKKLWNTITSKKVWRGDLLNVKKNGEKYWGRTIISPILDSKGDITNFIGLQEDITKLKIAEEEAQKFNFIINTTRDFIAFGNMENQMTYINKGGREFVGLSPDEDVTKLTIKDFLTDEEYKISVEERIPAVIKNGYWTGEYKLKHLKTGKSIPVWASTFLIKDPATGKPMGMGSILHDLTEKNEAIKALKQSEEKFKTLADSSINMIYIFRDNKFLYVNKMFSQKLGYTVEEIYSPSFDLFKNLLTPESKAHVKKGIEEHKKHNEIIPYELTFRTKIGEKIEVIDSSKIIKFNGEEAVMGILTDITQLKKVENELIAAKEKAEELNRLKSSFYANMSHELRTPLVGIVGASEILKEEIDDKELKGMAEIIHSSGSRLTKTLNNILNLSKVNSEKMLFDLKEMDLATIVSDRVKFFRNAIGNKDLYLNFVKEQETIKVNADKDRLIEIIDNILNNAIKFTKEGGITVNVNEQKFDDNIYSVISVKDTGIGIAAKDIKFIFEEYRQVSEGISRKFEGTGLGLTISKKYVELMNGTIEVISKPNVGSNFIVKFPILPSH